MKNTLNALSFLSIIALASCSKSDNPTNPNEKIEAAIAKAEGDYLVKDSITIKRIFVYQGDTTTALDQIHTEHHYWTIKKKDDSLQISRITMDAPYRSYSVSALRLNGDYLTDSFRNGGKFEFLSINHKEGKVLFIYEEKKSWPFGDSVLYGYAHQYITGDKSN